MGTSSVRILFVFPSVFLFFLVFFFQCFATVCCTVKIQVQQQQELLWFSLFNKNVLVSCPLNSDAGFNWVRLHKTHVLYNSKSIAVEIRYQSLNK